ncbi:META domain-containing protein [Niabella sp. CC-SYL272]|uniref:META domain-containing protein n=1 Tax=Niabella agricola TaxID=2891571 RepID=UPI001F40B80A|nr:META domain-containing protein [Niabella agricola]MCF3108632.1 META domain-containing protein [Niabella agricola]
MKIYLIYPVLLCAAILTACNRKTPPLVSTLKTEELHHKWRITELDGYAQPLPQTGLDLRNVYRSFAVAGCDTLAFTPRFGHHNRIALDELMVYSGSRNCRNDALSKVLKENLAAAYRFNLNGGQLELISRQGRSLLKAVIGPEDEKGSIRRWWSIVKMINVSSDSFALRHPFIDFTDLSASAAFVGCNQLRFTTTIAAPFSISISRVSGTYKYCRDAAGFESVLIKALPLVAKYQVIGHRMKLFDKENALLLEAVAADDPGADLQGSTWDPLRREWMLKKLDGVDGALVIRSGASINLTNPGQTGGMAGCNRALFTVKTGAGASIRFSAIATTKKFCTKFMKVEERYQALLPQIRSYELNGHFIRFKDAAGKILAEAVAADWD